MSEFDPASIAIGMTTMYPQWYKGKVRSIKHTEKIRGDLALSTAQKAHELGYKVVVVEHDSSRTFKRELAQIPQIVISSIRLPKRSPSKRKAIKIASKIPGVKVIVLTEPEKLSLITDCIPNIVEPILLHQADIVVPKRENTLFSSSYPSYMYASEKEGNALCNEMLKANGLLAKTDEDLDIFFVSSRITQ